MRISRLVVALLVSSGILCARSELLRTRISLEQNQDFCSNGVFPSTIWTERKTAGLNTWGSYCSGGDRTTGEAISAPFAASKYLSLYVAGYPMNPGMSLELQRVPDGTKLRITIPDQPTERWKLYDFRLPATWRGQQVRLIAIDQSSNPAGWLAFSEPVKSLEMSDWTDAKSILLRTTMHFLLMMIPCLALCALAVRSGVRDVVVLGAVALAATGICGFVAFWLWFIRPFAGVVVSFLIPIAGICVLVLVWRKLDPQGRGAITALIPPLLLIGTTAMLVTSSGFLYGGMGDPFYTASTRFSHTLPPDNQIPYLFAEQVRSGHVGRFVIGDWESSDRPPLQTGIVLSQYPFTARPRLLGYSVFSVILQSLWIFALWLLLISFRVSPHAISLTLVVCLFCGFTFMNSFYVWPKLIAAAYLISMFAVLVRNRMNGREQMLIFVLAGSLGAFSMLSHGGSAFALIGLGLTMLAVGKRMISFRGLAMTAAAAFVLYLPWMWYQKFYDPPGDRLLKLHLAGVLERDDRPFTGLLVAAYEKLSFKEIVEHKISNFEITFNHLAEYWGHVRNLAQSLIGSEAKSLTLAGQSAAGVKALMFFCFVPNLAFLVLGPFALLVGLNRRHRKEEWNAAAVIWLFVGLTAVSWCLLMFGPAGTIIATATYAMVLLAYAGSILALWAVSPWLALGISLLQIGLNFLVYVVYARQADLTVLSPELLLRYPTLILFLGSLALVIFLLRRIAGVRVAAGSNADPPTPELGQLEPLKPGSMD